MVVAVGIEAFGCAWCRFVKNDNRLEKNIKNATFTATRI